MSKSIEHGTNERTPFGSETNNATLEARRAFLKKAGKAAIYVPPTIMMLSHPSYAQFKSSLGKDKNKKGFQGDSERHSRTDFIERVQNMLGGIFSGFGMF